MKNTCKVLVILLAAPLLLIPLSQASANLTPLTPSLTSPAHTKENSNGPPILLYVCNMSGPNYYNDWSNVLAREGYIVYMTSCNQFSPPEDCTVIIIDPALDVSDGLASSINSTGKPVLALGLGGAKYLNHTGWTVVAHEFSGNGGFFSFSCPENARLHEVLEGVDVGLADFPLLEGENVTLVEDRGMILTRGTILTVPSLGNFSFLSVSGRVVHFAFHNVTVLDTYRQQGSWTNETFKLLLNTVGWLARGAPQYRLMVEVKAVYGYENVMVNVSVYDNWNVGWCTEPGNVALTVTCSDDGSTVYSGWQTGCNASFVLPVLEPGNYSVVAERGGCTGTASFTVQYKFVQLTDLTYRDGMLLVRVLVDGSPAEGVTVNFGYVDGFRVVADFWSVRDQFTLIGSSVTNGSGWACVGFSLDRVVTVVAWVDTLEAKNYTYHLFSPSLEFPSFDFPSSSLVVLLVPSSQFYVAGGLQGRAAGVASTFVGVVALFLFRRFRL